LLLFVLREPPPLNLPVAWSAATHVQRLRHRAGYHFVHCTSVNFPARASIPCPCAPRGRSTSRMNLGAERAVAFDALVRHLFCLCL